MVNSNKFALNAAGVFSAVYVACALFVTVFPEVSLNLMSALTHLDLGGVFGGKMRVTLSGFASGLIQVLLYSYVIAHLIAWVLNKSAKR